MVDIHAAAGAFGVAADGAAAHAERAFYIHAAVGSGVAGDGRAAAHAEYAVGSDIHTAAAFSDVVVDGAAAHAEHAICTHAHAAALCRVPGDLAAEHIKGATVGNQHTAAVAGIVSIIKFDPVLRNLAAVHIECTADVYAGALVLCRVVVSDRAIVTVLILAIAEGEGRAPLDRENIMATVHNRLRLTTQRNAVAVQAEGQAVALWHSDRAGQSPILGQIECAVGAAPVPRLEGDLLVPLVVMSHFIAGVTAAQVVRMLLPRRRSRR